MRHNTTLPHPDCLFRTVYSKEEGGRGEGVTGVKLAACELEHLEKQWYEWLEANYCPAGYCGLSAYSGGSRDPIGSELKTRVAPARPGP